MLYAYVGWQLDERPLRQSPLTLDINILCQLTQLITFKANTHVKKSGSVYSTELKNQAQSLQVTAMDSNARVKHIYTI